MLRGRNLAKTPAVLDLRVVGISRENTEVPLPNSRVCTMCTRHASLSNSKPSQRSLISLASYLGPSRRSSRTSNSSIPILPPRPPGSQAQVFRSRIDTSAGRDSPQRYICNAGTPPSCSTTHLVIMFGSWPAYSKPRKGLTR